MIIEHQLQLADRARAGDSAAASELLGHFYPRIYAYFRRLCGHDQQAEDLTQKTFIQAWSSLASFQDRSAFLTWIHGIARHIYLDWLRQKRPLQEQTDQWWEAQAARGATPFDDIAERDAAARLYALVDQLDNDIRETVHLHYYQNLTLDETAAVLQVATSTVKYRLRKALDLLKSRTGELAGKGQKNF